MVNLKRFCRVCLSQNVVLYTITPQLQEIFERLTLLEFDSKDKPVQTCYSCRMKLESCLHLKAVCIRSDGVLKRIQYDDMVNLEELENQSIDTTTVSLTITPVSHINICNVILDSCNYSKSADDSEESKLKQELDEELTLQPEMSSEDVIIIESILESGQDHNEELTLQPEMSSEDVIIIESILESGQDHNEGFRDPDTSSEETKQNRELNKTFDTGTQSTSEVVEKDVFKTNYPLLYEHLIRPTNPKQKKIESVEVKTPSNLEILLTKTPYPKNNPKNSTHRTRAYRTRIKQQIYNRLVTQ